MASASSSEQFPLDNYTRSRNGRGGPQTEHSTAEPALPSPSCQTRPYAAAAQHAASGQDSPSQRDVLDALLPDPRGHDVGHNDAGARSPRNDGAPSPRNDAGDFYDDDDADVEEALAELLPRRSSSGSKDALGEHRDFDEGARRSMPRSPRPKKRTLSMEGEQAEGAGFYNVVHTMVGLFKWGDFRWRGFYSVVRGRKLFVGFCEV